MSVPPVNASAHLSTRAAAWLGLLAVAGVLILQVPHLRRPPFDAHSYRQAQTLSTIELFARDGIDLAHAPTNYVGEPGIFVLELPLFQALAALFYGWFGPQVWIVRGLNLLFTLLNAGLIFTIGQRMLGRVVGGAAALLYLFAPLQQVFMGSTLIDPSAITGSLLAFLVAHRLLVPQPGERAAPAALWALFVAACVVTALIKPLYLFPTCVLLTGVFLRERRMTARLWGAGAILALAGVLFGLWMRHGREVNNASWFTRGIDPTVLLGFRVLASPEFYFVIAKRVLIHLAGPAGGLLLLAAIGLVLLRGGREEVRASRFSLGVLLGSLLGYYAVFPRVNFPHDYYSLIIAPYACLIAGLGAREVARFLADARSGPWRAAWFPQALALAAVAVSVTWFFIRLPVRPHPGLMELQRLSAGRFEPWAYGIVVARPMPGLGIPPEAEAPAVLYATGLRGKGRVLSNEATAAEVMALWEEQRPHYKSLRYFVFYGLPPPAEIRRQCGEPLVTDDAGQFHAFRVK